MSLFDLQDVCIAIGSIATLDLPMVVDLIGIYGLKGPYCTLTTTNWFLQALSMIPRGSWGDIARRSYHDPMGKSGIVIRSRNGCGPTASCIPEPLRVTQVLDSRFPHGYSAQCVEHEKRILGNLSAAPPLLSQAAAAAAVRRLRRRPLRRKFVSGQFDEENPSALISSRLLVQGDEGVSYPVVDRIGVIYRNLPRRADVIVTTVGARHKCQQADCFPIVLCSSSLISCSVDRPKRTPSFRPLKLRWLRTQSLLLYAALDLRLCHSAPHHSALEFCS
ncbi:hypothetical protein F511_17699 [Dorcoceras hygrometricum]|uniref:Uncharacterized protein n=1 Tax=Dorcoceras hygrometricum TaxID=472368 RepID=A0A2Z7B6Z8_9LAMI|nr:hypothetical protein F511_17699 [Dorcoceras hygrometricum]